MYVQCYCVCTQTGAAYDDLLRGRRLLLLRAPVLCPHGDNRTERDPAPGIEQVVPADRVCDEGRPKRDNL